MACCRHLSHAPTTPKPWTSLGPFLMICFLAALAGTRAHATCEQKMNDNQTVPMEILCAAASSVQQAQLVLQTRHAVPIQTQFSHFPNAHAQQRNIHCWDGMMTDNEILLCNTCGNVVHAVDPRRGGKADLHNISVLSSIASPAPYLFYNVGSMAHFARVQ